MSFKTLLFIVSFLPFLGVSQDSITASSVLTEQANNQLLIESAPITFGSDTLFTIKGSSEVYPVALRAQEISQRLEEHTEKFNKLRDSLHLVVFESHVEAKLNDKLLFITTNIEGERVNLPAKELARLRLKLLEDKLASSETLTTKEWFTRIGLFVLSLVVLIALIKFINWLFRRINTRLSKIEKDFLKKQSLVRYFIPRKTANIFVFIANIIRLSSIAFVLFFGAPFLFSFFPWAEDIVGLFYSYISKPVNYIVTGVINFIPSLFFIIIILICTRYVVRVIKEITIDIDEGKLEIPNFHRDWARPTGKILNLFIWALSLVLIFPYLPGSGSSAFQGVSIFIGAIISFGSTSAIANIIAGVVITYMRPFQIGDRVKIDNIVGDVVEKTILVTHLRTPKNVDVTIPNANILIGKIENYSNTENGSVVLHTTVTLGYDLPWQKAQELLLEAANRTEFVEKEPKPFVLQTSLDDFYVSYELNVHTFEAKKMPLIYSELHKHILDVFNEAGVEILSPGYVAARDGSTTTVPSKIDPKDQGIINKLVNHLTGRNQKNTFNQPDTDESKAD